MSAQRIQLELIYQDREIVLHEFDSEFILGRLEACDLFIQYRYTSRRHATISCQPGQFILQDHSSNGSYIQDQQRKLISLHQNALPLHGSGIISLGVEPVRNPEHLVKYRVFSVTLH